MWHQRMKMSPRQLLLILGITAAAVSAQGESLTDDWTLFLVVTPWYVSTKNTSPSPKQYAHILSKRQLKRFHGQNGI